MHGVFASFSQGRNIRYTRTGLAFRIVNQEVIKMLRWAVIFLIIALVAAVFGFTGIAVAAAEIAKFLFFLFLVMFLIFLILGMATGKKVL
jgi:uncharacterized membrane protein YtjA (UPF0391 family)